MSVKSAKCGRWNPTAEQVKVLSELFRSGLRTPSTDQIQNISDHLSFYGNVESKNVFYWFQNHKARERQSLSLDSSPKHLAEINQVSEPERVIETLQLFPLNTTYEEPEAEKMRHYAGEGKENAAYTYNFFGGKDHPPLDLRLSFF